ncbi:LysR family transcriptional regulator [Brucella anthropi]|uniref:LysR family transcriptional regulator n=1 Tax=Hyphomicrobiales TaxID=356 RepID=UPI00124EB27B|nr:MULTISPECIES: LysR family transcriptional regulator [Hyphomicrobiales]KAB2786834.1 LysR family transcriptional regulator [Brucella anthropi]MBP1846467.1 DNA-binding transcriptional LysR family regulator [Neorhizobium petrolearium]MDX4076168.1 LysR family transcriptional regulator [Brucella sp. NBRC 113783]
MDLNLIRVLDALAEEGNVTKAGARLGLSQSAVSHALNKMRLLFDDQLFLRGPDGMHPTPRAMELSRAFGSALRQIDAAVGQPAFDPATADFEIVIATSDYVTSTIIPSLLQAVAKSAPGVRLWIRPMNDVNIVEELDRGAVHLAAGAFGTVPARFVKTDLFSDPNVWMFRADHPAADDAMSLETLGKYPHIDILISRRDSAVASAVIDQSGLERAYVTSNPQYLDGLLRDKGLERRVGATLSHILAVPPLLATTDMVAYVPLRFARFAEKTFRLTWREAPYVAPPMTISTLTHRALGRHPSITWFEKLLQVGAHHESGVLPYLP